MNPSPRRQPRGFGRKHALLALALLPVLTTAIFSQGPSWWQDRSVIAENPQGQPLPPDDHAVVNLGQLKHTAVQARAELHELLPPSTWSTPSGQALDALVAAWFEADGVTPKAGIDNRAAVNQGQLKYVAKHFYDVLTAADYLPGQGLPPATWIHGPYPWTNAITDDANTRPAVLGQLKFLFSWDLRKDSDQDGLSDHVEHISGSSDRDGDGLDHAQELAAGTSPLLADSDGDGVLDGTDDFPLDPARHTTPSPNPLDTTAPILTLDSPANAVLVN